MEIAIRPRRTPTPSCPRHPRRCDDDRHARTPDHANAPVEIDRFTPDEDADWEKELAASTIEGCRSLLTAGDHVVVDMRAHLAAFDTADDFALAWADEKPADDAAVVLGDQVIILDASEDDEATFLALSADKGKKTSSTDVDREGQAGHFAALDDTHAAVTFAGSKAPRLVVIELDGDDLDVVTQIVQKPGDDDYTRLPTRVALLGTDDLLIGWTGDEPSAFTTAGKYAWTYPSSSFNNKAGAIGATADATFIGPIGGSWLELIDPDGETFHDYAKPPKPAWGSEPANFTRLDDHTMLIAGHGAREGDADDTPAYFAFFDTGDDPSDAIPPTTKP